VPGKKQKVMMIKVRSNRTIFRCLVRPDVFQKRFDASIIYESCSKSEKTRLFSSMNGRESSSTAGDDYTHFGFTEIPRSEKDSRVKSVFNSVAESYDTMNDLMSLGVHRYWKDEFVRATSVDLMSDLIRKNSNDERTTLKVLDVAGGTGDISFRLLDAANCLERSKSSGEDLIQITVCDINSKMLQIGKQRARERYNALLDETKALKFEEGSAENLPFEDDTFDLYTIAFGLRNVTNTNKALEEAYRVLKPGGRFMCLEFSKIENSCSLFSSMYDFYSFNVIPFIGKHVANDRESYQYLVESIQKFYDQEDLKRKIHDSSFRSVEYMNMSFGIVAIHQGWKI